MANHLDGNEGAKPKRPFELTPTLLRAWQRDFLQKISAKNARRFLLVAPPGAGKTRTALLAAQEAIKSGRANAVMSIVDRQILGLQWNQRAADMGLEFPDLKLTREKPGFSVDLTRIEEPSSLSTLQRFALAHSLFVIVDGVEDVSRAYGAVKNLIGDDVRHRALFLSHTFPTGIDWDDSYAFDNGVFSGPQIFVGSAVLPSFAKLAPSYQIVERIVRGELNIDGLSWRQYEKLIADLLVLDGYKVDLMQGTKDGGVDVIAVKDCGLAGVFKTLWQAKKYGRHKVGLAVVRELADTRNELGASKAMVVTTSYLTKGALNRVERDRFILGKVDRDDLQNWMSRYLLTNR